MARWTAAGGLTAWFLLLALIRLVASAAPLAAIGSQVDLVLFGLAYLTVVLSLLAGMQRFPRRRTPLHLWIVAAWVLYAAGDAVSSFTAGGVDAADQLVADPGDAVTMLAYLLALVLLVVPALRSRRRVRVDLLLDGGAVALSLGSLAWVTLLAPGLRSSAWNSRVAVVVEGVYPALDLLLLVLGIVMVASRRPVGRARLVALLCPLMLMVADAAAVVTFAHGGSEHQGAVQHVCWMLAYGAFAVAAQIPPGAVFEDGRERTTAPRGRTRRPWVFLLALLPAALYAWEIGTRGRGAPDAIVLDGVLLAMAVLVVLRAANLVRRADDQSGDLAELASLDHLTGLPNRRAGDAELWRMVQRATATGEPLTVAILDLDHFKVFNDTHGHHAGDVLLATCARRWARLLGPAEVLYRYGGEEFALVTVGLPASAVLHLVERMRAVTPEAQSFSAGIATWRPGETPAGAVRRADEALYAAKTSGRDRVLLYEPPAVAAEPRSDR